MLAPSLVENQHPDHARLGKLVRDATRLARYGGVHELKDLPPHTIGHLLYYAVSPDAEPRDITPVYFDVSAPEISPIGPRQWKRIIRKPRPAIMWKCN